MLKKISYVDHQPATPAEIASRLEERRHRDRVTELADGFAFRPDGRHGYIYYREGEKVLEMMWEMSGSQGSDIILYLEGLQKWVAPVEQALELEKRQQLEAALRVWLAQNRIRAILEGGG